MGPIPPLNGLRLFEAAGRCGKIILGTAIAAVSIASPALAQHASEKGHLMSVRHTGHVRAVTHLSALRSFASITRGLDDPASTGGGSMRYNASLRLNHW